MTQRILLLSPFFYPEPISTGKYNTCVAKELVSRGHEVDVISSHPLYPEWVARSTQLKLPGMQIFRGGENVRYPSSQYLRRLYLETWYTFFSIFRILKNKKKYDIVIPIFPPSLFLIFVSIILPEKVKIRGIVHDLQGIHAGKSKNIITYLISKAILFAENTSFKRCNKLIFLSYEMESYVKENYKISTSTKTVVSYPFFNICKYETPEKSDNLKQLKNSNLKRIFGSSFYHVVYSGALGIKQNPEGLINFFQVISKKYNDIVCHIFSAGPIFEKYSNLNQSEAINKIKFHPLVSEEELSELYSYSSCQVIPQKSGTSSGSLPSKLPNLVNCSVPIFCICDKNSEISNIINTNSLGSVSYTWDIDTLESLFENFKNSYLENLDPSFADRSYKVSRKLFDITNTIHTLIQ